eukprot:5185824-Amphidinium_carterae.1
MSVMVACGPYSQRKLGCLSTSHSRFTRLEASGKSPLTAHAWRRVPHMFDVHFPHHPTTDRVCVRDLWSVGGLRCNVWECIRGGAALNRGDADSKIKVWNK